MYNRLMNNRICEAGVTAAPTYNKATTCGTEPTQLATVTIPAYQGGDGANDPFKPTLGAWRNTIVYYAKNGAVYLYDVNGVYTNLTGTDWGSQIAEAMTQIDAVSSSLGSLTSYTQGQVAKLEQQDEELSTQLNSLSSRVNTQFTDTSNAIANLTSELANVSSITNENTDNIATETTNREAAITELQTQLSSQANEQATTNQNLQEVINNNTADITALQEAAAGDTTALSKTVVYSVASGADASTVNLEVGLGQLNEDTVSQQQVALPVASEEQAGVMNASMYETFQGLVSSVEAIQGGTVEISDLAADPAQDDLTAAWKTATGKTDLIPGAKIYDSANSKIWTYYANTETWISQPAGEGSVSVNLATNTSAGIVMGSTEDGQVAVEGNGQMSVNGWDAYTTKVDTNTVNLTALTERVGEIPELLEQIASGAGVTWEDIE